MTNYGYKIRLGCPGSAFYLTFFRPNYRKIDQNRINFLFYSYDETVTVSSFINILAIEITRNPIKEITIMLS